jgi:hypothetical protein
MQQLLHSALPALQAALCLAAAAHFQLPAAAAAAAAAGCSTDYRKHLATQVPLQALVDLLL